LKSQHEICYWTAENATAAIDFVVQHQNQIIPIEIKAEGNRKSKSQKVYLDKFATNLVIRTSMSKYRQESWLTNIPLYGIFLGRPKYLSPHCIVRVF
jgi:predicted AAA+ superfamily ATPase